MDEQRRLPDGTWSTDLDKYLKAWRELGQPFAGLMGIEATGFDPGVLFTGPTAADTLTLTPRVLVKINKLLAELTRLRAVVDKLPKYADTGQPIVCGMEVWVSGPHPTRDIARAVLNTSVLLEGHGFLTRHQRYCCSTPEAAKGGKNDG